MEQTSPPHRARAIFDNAMEFESAAERARFISTACDGDAALQERVVALLNALDRPADLLELPPRLLGASDLAELASRPLREGCGTVIGPYTLLKEMGEGGMGVVFLAEQTRPVRRQVALKVIKAGMDTRQVVARFEAERQTLALMDHPHIAKVLDAGSTESGRPYFVMELVQGVPITSYCDDHRLTVRRRLELLICVCEAVQHAHTKGIIHRDLKPTNVLVPLYDGKPVPKVIDFGVAKATGGSLGDGTMFTGFGGVVGTPQYMSPEQAELNPVDVDTRADVYSLGVLLYELLTGTTPMEQKQIRASALLETLRVIREQDTPRPSDRLSGVADVPRTAAARGMEPQRLIRTVRGELDWIAMKAVEKDRQRRYETADALAADLQRYLRGEAVGACPPKLAYRARKLVLRHKGLSVAAGALVIAVLATIAGLAAVNARITRERNEKDVALDLARLSAQKAQDQLVVALTSQARASRHGRQVGQRLATLEAVAEAARISPSDELRDEAIAAMALPDVRRGQTWMVPAQGHNPMAFDRHYQRCACIDNQGIISIRGIPDDKEQLRLVPIGVPPLGELANLQFSPDGTVLAAVDSGGTLRVWELSDGKQVFLGRGRTFAFDPNGRHILAAIGTSMVRIDYPGGREVGHWQLQSEAKSIGFHPDGSKVAVGFFSSGIASVCGAADGRHVCDLPVGDVADQVVAWHPDGNRLAVAGSNPRIQIWDVGVKRKLATLEGHVQHVTALGFHPDGSLLASTSWDGTVRLWDPSSGRPLLQMPCKASIQFSTNGRWLGVALQTDRAQLLEVVSAREYRTIVSSLGAGQGGYYRGDISPDGRLLALAMTDGVRLWDLHSAQELALMPPAAANVCFNPVGAGWELLTSNFTGVHRWPARSVGNNGRRIQLGPPNLRHPLSNAAFARGEDGTTRVAMYSGRDPIVILDPNADSAGQTLGVHVQGEGAHALSNDGRWLASCGWHSDRVRLWNVQSGSLAHEWVLGPQNGVFFTPDSSTLIICRGEDFTFWDVQSLQLTRRLRRDAAVYPGYVAFSPCRRLMALEMAPAVIHLQEIATGRTIARLEDPHGDRATWMGFTPDGTRLVVASVYAKAVHVWDLRAIRANLKELRLDWDWQDFLPPGQPSQTQPTSEDGSVQIEVVRTSAAYRWPLNIFRPGRTDRFLGKPAEAVE